MLAIYYCDPMVFEYNGSPTLSMLLQFSARRDCSHLTKVVSWVYVCEVWLSLIGVGMGWWTGEGAELPGGRPCISSDELFFGVQSNEVWY